MPIKLIAINGCGNWFTRCGSENNYPELLYLVHFVPALRVLGAEHGVVVQQRLRHLRVVFLRHRQVDGREVLRVAIIG